MKTRLLAATAGLALFFPPLTEAGYEIVLKNEKTFVVEQYWEEEQQIKFNWRGGVLGIPAQKVKSITSTEAPGQDFVEPAISMEQETEEPPAEEPKEEVLPPTDQQAIKEAAAQKIKALNTRMLNAQKQFIKAQESGDKQAVIDARKVLLDLLEEQNRLEQQMAQ